MGVGASLCMHDVVVQNFTFAISSADEFLCYYLFVGRRWLNDVLCHAMYSLGALRDGEGNDCSTDDQFVMAARPQELNDNNLKNPYQFSQCSIDAFRDILYE